MTYIDKVWHQEKRVFSMSGPVTGERIAKIVAKHNLYEWKVDIERKPSIGVQLVSTYIVTFTKNGVSEEI